MSDNDELFDTHITFSNDKDPQVLFEVYFNHMYHGDPNEFIYCISRLVNKIGYATDGASCFFPEADSFDESDHFEGVRISVGDPCDECRPTQIVCGEYFYERIYSACEAFARRHPEYKNQVNEILVINPAIGISGDSIRIKFKK